MAMNTYRVVVSFEVDADSEDDACHQAMNEGPNGCTVESVVEVLTFPPRCVGTQDKPCPDCDCIWGAS
jgi:hypothetical protein